MGDIVCLYAPVISQFNTPGMWRSSDPQLVEIQSDLDIAFVQNKEGTVVLTHSLLGASPLQIQVLPISEIEFFPPGNQFLTNGKEDTTFRVPLVLHSEKSVGMKTNNLVRGFSVFLMAIIKFGCISDSWMAMQSRCEGPS